MDAVVDGSFSQSPFFVIYDTEHNEPTEAFPNAAVEIEPGGKAEASLMLVDRGSKDC